MLCAARDGETAQIQALLERDPNLYRCEYWYTQPLLFAVREGHLEAVKCLLHAGADPDWRSLDGEDLTVWARDRGHESVAQYLEAARPEAPPTPSSVDHAIHLAAAQNDTAMIRKLAAEDPNCLNLPGRLASQPLHVAVIHEATDAMAMLLSLGADLHAKHGSAPVDEGGYPPVSFEPLDLTLWRGPFWNIAGNTDLTQQLIRAGAQVDAVIAAALGDLGRLKTLYSEDPDAIHRPRANGKHALSSAVEFGHEAIARWLLDHDADPNQPDGPEAPQGTALHAAARMGMQELVALLLEKGADPNSYIDSRGSATYAAKTPEIRRMLLDHGGHLDPYDLVWLGEDESAFQQIQKDPTSALAGCGGIFAVACTLGKRGLLQRVLDLGIKVPATVTACRSYLLHNPDMLELLLASGMNPDLPNWLEATLLHCLCSRDSRGRPRPHARRCASMLLEAGASLTSRDDHYCSTPLAWAARHNLLDMAQWLLEQGAPVSLPDDPAWATPHAWAKRRGFNEMIKLLGGAGAKA